MILLQFFFCFCKLSRHQGTTKTLVVLQVGISKACNHRTCIYTNIKIFCSFWNNFSLILTTFFTQSYIHIIEKTFAPKKQLRCSITYIFIIRLGSYRYAMFQVQVQYHDTLAKNSAERWYLPFSSSRIIVVARKHEIK